MPDPALRLLDLAKARLAEAERGDAPHGWGKFAADGWRKYISDLESPSPSHDGDCERPYRPSICNCAKRSRLRKGLSEWTDGDAIYAAPDCSRCINELWFNGDNWQCDECHAIFHSDLSFSHFYDDMGDDLMDGVDRAEIERALLGGAA